MALVNFKGRIDLLHINSPKEIISIDTIINDSNRSYDVAVNEYRQAFQNVDRAIFDKYVVMAAKDRSAYHDLERITFPPHYNLTIENLRVMGSAGILVTADDKIIYESVVADGRSWDANGKNDFVLYKNGQIDLQSLLYGGSLIPAPQYINGTATVLTCPYDAYGHGLKENFSALLLMKELETDYIYCRYDAYPVFQEALELLRVPQERLICATPGQHIMFKKANIILPVIGLEEMVKANRKWVQELGFHDIEPTEKSFALRFPAGRGNFNKRYIINRDEVKKYLAEKGFSEIIWENLTLEEKIKKSRATRFFISDTVSGELNFWLWAKPKTKWLSLVSPLMLEAFRFHFSEYFLKDIVRGLAVGGNIQPPEFFNAQLRNWFVRDENFRVNNACFTVDMEKLDYVITEMEKR